MEWRISDGLIDYEQAVRTMEDRVAAIRAGEAADLLDPSRLPVYQTGRGGQYTYHGPGQRIAYVMLDLQRREMDVRSYVALLENWLIATLHRFNLRGERRQGRVGIWIDRGQDAEGRGQEDKIGAIGVRVRRWVTYHGIALNVEPDLSHYAGIVPCGIQEHGVTSLVDLGLPVDMAEVDVQLAQAWDEVFGGEGR